MCRGGAKVREPREDKRLGSGWSVLSSAQWGFESLASGYTGGLWEKKNKKKKNIAQVVFVFDGNVGPDVRTRPQHRDKHLLHIYSIINSVSQLFQ